MSAMQAAGNVFQGVFNRNAARRRATILKKDAIEARLLGAIQADMIEDEGQLEVGAAVARQGASGFGMDTGALAVIGDLAARYGQRARVARYEAGRRAVAMQNDAAAEQAAGTMHLIKGLSDAAGSIAQGRANKAASSGGG